MKLDDFPPIHANFQQHVYALGIVDAESHKVRRPSDVSLGSAFAVSSEGHFLSAFHVIEREYEHIKDGTRVLALEGVSALPSGHATWSGIGWKGI